MGKPKINSYIDQRLAQYDQVRKRRVDRIEAELQRLQAEEAERARIERETPPCKLGQRCEWATHTGVNITCSRLIAGCVKLEGVATDVPAKHTTQNRR